MDKKRRILTGIFMLFAVFMLTGIKLPVKAYSKYTIYVNRKSNIVNVVNRKGKLVRAMYCSTGKHYSTIRGTFHTESRYRWHLLSHGVYGQYCTRIHGPYLFHSVWYYRTKKSQVSVREYNKLGSQASMGCVRLAVVDARWIYRHCRLGTKVVIGEKRKLAEPDRKKIKLSSSSGRSWDPTDPDSSNPYYPKIKMKKGASKKIEFGSKFDPLEQITVSSKITGKKELIKYVTVKGTVKTETPGKYKLVYTVKDPATLLSKSLKVTYLVKEKPVKEEVPAEAASDKKEAAKEKDPAEAASDKKGAAERSVGEEASEERK
jgi:hypothetical protein